jgi:PAS domain S-box-containing protein
MQKNPIAAQDQLQYQAGLIENISDAIISIDEKLIIKSWNKAAEKIYGWTSAEAIGQPIETLLHTEYINTSMNESEHELSANGNVQLDVIHRDKKGNKHTVRCSISVLKDNRGNRLGSVGVLHDITQLKQAEELFAEREQHYRALFDLCPAGILLADSKGIIMEVNDALCRNFDYTREELLGKNVNILIPVERHSEVPKLAAEILNGKTLQHEVERFTGWS